MFKENKAPVVNSNSFEKLSTIDIKKPQYEIKLYKRRWINLMLLILIETANAGQWVQYSIIANITMRYYGISARMVDGTALVYLITYLPLVIPASYWMDKWGLRFTMLVAATGNFIGSWLKVPSACNPDLFYVGFLGQTVLSSVQVFILSVPPRFAAVWFGSDQVSTACSLGVFGQQLGMCMGFILTPLFVRNHVNLEDIGNDFFYLFLYIAIFTTVTLIVVIFVFDKEPPLPPSQAQALVRVHREQFSVKRFLKSFKRLLLSGSFIKLGISFGTSIGVFNVLATFLNPIILAHFPGSEIFAGQLGLILVIAGIIGSVIFGYILDKTRKFKETTCVVYIFTTLFMFSFPLVLNTKSHWLVIAISAGIGLFMTGYLPIAYEFAAELSYPEPETNSAGILNTIATLIGAVFIIFFGWILENFGDFWCNIGMASLMICGSWFTFTIPNKLRRQAAANSHKSVNYKSTSVTENPS